MIEEIFPNDVNNINSPLIEHPPTPTTYGFKWFSLSAIYETLQQKKYADAQHACCSSLQLGLFARIQHLVDCLFCTPVRCVHTCLSCAACCIYPSFFTPYNSSCDDTTRNICCYTILLTYSCASRCLCCPLNVCCPEKAEECGLSAIDRDFENYRMQYAKGLTGNNIV